MLRRIVRIGFVSNFRRRVESILIIVAVVVIIESQLYFQFIQAELLNGSIG